MGRSIVLHEWERRPHGLASDEALIGLSFEDPSIERAARALRESGRLLVRETRRGLSIEARAHVGVVQIGPLRVTDNQVVRAGLRLARQAVHTPELRGALGQAERTWEERCRSVHLDSATLARVERERTRLTAAYEPAHRLVALLWSLPFREAAVLSWCSTPSTATWL